MNHPHATLRLPLIPVLAAGLLLATTACARPADTPATAAPAAAGTAQVATPAVPAPSAITGSLTDTDVRARVTAAGYTDVKDIRFDDGIWDADARTTDGRWIDVRIHPVSGKVYADGAQPAMTRAQIEASLTTAGYTEVKDVEFDDGVWKADARTGAGAKVDLRLDPDDGSVITERAD